MPYVPFNPAVPDGSVQTGPQVTPSIRDNQRALVDAILIGGVTGWNLAVTGPNYDEPSMLTYTKGTDKIQATITWSNGNPTSIKYERDSGAGWELIGTKTIRYTAQDQVVGVDW